MTNGLVTYSSHSARNLLIGRLPAPVRGRFYLPLQDCAKHGVNSSQIESLRHDAQKEQVTTLKVRNSELARMYKGDRKDRRQQLVIGPWPECPMTGPRCQREAPDLVSSVQRALACHLHQGGTR